MILRRCPIGLSQSIAHDAGSSIRLGYMRGRRHASAAAAVAVDDAFDELDPSPSVMNDGPSEDVVQSFDPVGQSQKRGKELPASRYQYRPPKYYRGPLHPHQPPPASDPSSRAFVPGPFTLPRLEQTYQSTIAPDIMTLMYTHVPPGYRPPPREPRLRPWDGSSPYHKNRPPRGPRGGSALRLLRQPITFRNVPRIERVTVHTMVSEATVDSSHLHAAGMVVQAITGARVTAVKSKTDVARWGLRKNRYIGVKTDLTGEDMYHFLSRCIDIVLPRVKEWPGVAGHAGDKSGNITFGMTPAGVRLFPEIEVNYDMYPSEMIPGLHVTIHTSARTDRDGRLLLSAFGLPFSE